MSIRARLLLLILFATLIPAAVGGIGFLEYRESEIAAAREDLVAGARQVALDLTGTVRSTAQLHYGLSRARDFDQPERAACSAFLADVLKEHPQYTGILTIEPNGQLLCDSLRTGRTLNLTDRRYFQQAINARHPLAVEPAFGRLTGIAVLQVAYGVRRDSGEPRFVLLASLNLEKYMQAQARSLPRVDAVVALIDSAGLILTWHPGGEKRRGTSIADSAMHRFVLERQGENVREDLAVDGVSRIWAASTLPGLPEAGLHVVVGVSKDDLLAAANRKVGQALATLAVASMLVFTGAWALVERGVRRPAARIVEAVRRFSGGDFGVRIGSPYPSGEIGGLMAALDHAFGVMQAQRDEVDRLNANLELSVTERTAELEASIKDLESFAYSVSHDLRAPLRAIDGFARILGEDHGGQLDGEARRVLAVIQSNSRKMGQLIDDLLEYSRLGRKPLSVADVDMKRMVEEALPDVHGAGWRAGKVTVAALPVAAGDVVLLKQAWLNLLSNAVKFSSKRETPLVEVTGHENSTEVVYCVKDNGAGFDMQYYDKLFGVFHRLHSVEEFEGTGVGLAIVQRVIARHGGRVWAEGKVNEGAAFYFSLPRGKRDGQVRES